jgi:PKD repeat protein
MVSQTAWKIGNNWNVPMVFTQVDYNNDPSQGLGSGEQPAAFWYVNNINFPAADFTDALDNIPPTITLNGQDTVTVLINTSYTEAGATAFDCTDGNITPTIVNAPDTAVVGIYNVLYIATDAAGNSDTVTRLVIVGAVPVADFTWSFPQYSYKAQFTDQSINLPTEWVWQFGDGGGSIAQNPVKTYTANNATGYNVCLTAKNAFGSSAQVCKIVSITGVGIDEPEFSQHLSMFPNPTNGKVTIMVDGNVSSDMTVTVYNILGEVVKEPTFYKAGTTQMEIIMSNVLNGLYLVKIASQNGTAVKQLTVNHK